MPNKSKVVPIATPPLQVEPRALAGHGVLRNQIIVSIGPVVLAVDYAVRITELKGVPCDGSSPVLPICGAAKSPSAKPKPSGRCSLEQNAGWHSTENNGMLGTTTARAGCRAVRVSD